MTETEWYTNKELYEMMMALGKGLEATNGRLEATNIELAETRTAMRQYNSLREKIEMCEQKLAENAGRQTGGRDMWGYLVGGIGILFAILSRLS